MRTTGFWNRHWKKLCHLNTLVYKYYNDWFKIQKNKNIYILKRRRLCGKMRNNNKILRAETGRAGYENGLRIILFVIYFFFFFINYFLYTTIIYVHVEYQEDDHCQR